MDYWLVNFSSHNKPTRFSIIPFWSTNQTPSSSVRFLTKNIFHFVDTYHILTALKWKMKETFFNLLINED